jgi:WD40 repeat protein
VDLSGIAKVWDPTTFALRREIRSYSAPLNTTAFSRDGRFLVTAGKDLSIWEADTGARMQLIADHGNLYAAAMSANGRRIAVGGRGGFLALLDCDVCVPMDQLLQRGAERPPRELTSQERKDLRGGR